MSRYSTKATWLGNEYGCRILLDGKPILEGRCETRSQIGMVFQDLMRTIDKLGASSDSYTHSARMRRWEKGEPTMHVKHIWL